MRRSAVAPWVLSFACLLAACSSSSTSTSDDSGSPADDTGASSNDSSVAVDSSTANEAAIDDSGATPDDSTIVDGGDDGDAIANETADDAADTSDSSANDSSVDAPSDVTVADDDTIHRRLTALDTLGRKFASLASVTDMPSRMVQFAAAASTVTDVSSVSVDPSGFDTLVTLWDGDTIDFEGSMTPSAGPADPPPPDPLSFSISSKKKALVLVAERVADPQNVRIGEFLTAAGYDVQTGIPDLPTLRTKLQDGSLAVVYVNTHGSPYDIATDTPVTDTTGAPMRWNADDPVTYDTLGDASKSTEKDPTIAIERAGRLVSISTSQYFVGADKIYVEARYSIKPRFVKTYWNLADHAVVAFDACFAGTNSGFFDALSTVNADVYLGWANPMPNPQGFNTSNRFWDDVLGTNKFSTLTEPQRPFDVNAELAYLQSKGIDTATGNGQTGTYKKYSTGDSVVLVPSIQNIDMYQGPCATDGCFDIEGMFGPDAGKVTIGGVATSCGSWSSTKISQCALPAIGSPGAYGAVVVDYDGRKSNPVPITHWAGTLTYTYTAQSSFSETINLSFHLRADVHRYRTTPRETPRERQYPAFFTDGGGNTKCAWTEAISGACTMSNTVPFVAGSTSPFCGLQVKIDTSLAEPMRIKLQPTLLDFYVCGATKTPVGDFSQDPSLPNESAAGGSGIWYWAGLNRDTYVFEAGDRTDVKGLANFEMKWPDLPPDAPPGAKDPR